MMVCSISNLLRLVVVMVVVVVLLRLPCLMFMLPLLLMLSSLLLLRLPCWLLLLLLLLRWHICLVGLRGPLLLWQLIGCLVLVRELWMSLLLGTLMLGQLPHLGMELLLLWEMLVLVRLLRLGHRHQPPCCRRFLMLHCWRMSAQSLLANTDALCPLSVRRCRMRRVAAFEIWSLHWEPLRLLILECLPLWLVLYSGRAPLGWYVALLIAFLRPGIQASRLPMNSCGKEVWATPEDSGDFDCCHSSSVVCRFAREGFGQLFSNRALLDAEEAFSRCSFP